MVSFPRQNSPNLSISPLSAVFQILLFFLFSMSAYAGAVVTANPFATKVGMKILRSGGNVVDAGVGIQYVLGLVEPQSSGLGGGSFAIFYHKKTDELYAIDGREKAPKRIPHNFFEQYKGSRQGFFKLVTNPASVGVPGTPLLLEEMHARFGQLDWSELHHDAISLAAKGFPISSRLNVLVTRDKFLKKNVNAKKYFFSELNDNLIPKNVGIILNNPSYSDVLTQFRDQGISTTFYKGKIMSNILSDLKKTAGTNFLHPDDFEGYSITYRKPLCGAYRNFRVCSMGPPSSGATTILQILGILENYELAKLETNSPELIHLISEATYLSFLDRNSYLGDPDFVNIPITQMLDKNYLKQRARLISPLKKIENASPGKFKNVLQTSYYTDHSMDSTTHFVITDKWGNALSMTSSVESAFGSRIMSQGFFLNNQLTDFAFRQKGNNGIKLQNSLEPEKRPLSSMSPTIIFDKDDNLFALLGSPGGKNIISYVLQTIVRLIDFNFDPTIAVREPRFVNTGTGLVLEKGKFPLEVINRLKKIGHYDLKERRLFSGIHVIKIKKDKIKNHIETGVDPRREGMALIE
tara:strand:+ start:4334 stop:6070 length:1737 start_codon:yes stop_codon:yes gene_type:complete